MFYYCSDKYDVLCNKDFNAKLYLFFISVFYDSLPYCEFVQTDKYTLYHLYVDNVEKMDRKTFYKYYDMMIEFGLVEERDKKLYPIVDTNLSYILNAKKVAELLTTADNLTVQLYLYLFYIKPLSITDKKFFYLSDFVEFSGRPRQTGGCRRKAKESLQFLIDNKYIECEGDGTKKRLFKVY